MFAAYPFQYAGDENVLVAQMVNFVEALPTEWDTIWREKLSKAHRGFPCESSESVTAISLAVLTNSRSSGNHGAKVGYKICRPCARLKTQTPTTDHQGFDEVPAVR